MHHSQSRSGVLTVRIFSGRNLNLAPNVQLPSVIQQALASGVAQGAGGAAATSQRANRESVQRKRSWWLPYVVLQFDKQEVFVDALGGEMGSPAWMYKAHFDVSRLSDLSISAYLRTQPPASGEDQNNMGNDLLICRLDHNLVLDGHHVADQWYPATAGIGQFHLQISFKPRAETLTMDQFELLKVIGKGSFGKVMQVKKKDTSRVYALKTIRKAHIASRPGEITHILAERTVLALVNNPFVVPLKFSFQSVDKLYLVMSFVNGGELFYHLQREGKFDQNRSRFYAAELLCALEHLHSFNVIYRDLKPENILLDYTGHIALCDFGLCKLNMSEKEKTNTFCGTPEYIAPELLESQGYTKTVDWWTLGVLLYEMMTGLPPFYDENVNTMYQRILSDPLRFPEDMPADARSIMTGLLNRDPNRRLGVNGAEEIKRHPFFAKHIDWDRLIAKKITPPFKPSVTGQIDVSNFDPEFTLEPPMDSVVTDSALSETVQDQFRGFTYIPANEYMGESVQQGSVMS
ncbi:AGC protein kinase Gad8 [Tulasnella sp. 330]|nr:AGC protein kinase Gad8 [Tulasnella sp. 330]KAG8870654.1 AGC protein kinase Gad8 [Tulasnella sp. 332]KAG8877312.1 AGC protein kinase Gad8 [Tulasnella sp. 331]